MFYRIPVLDDGSRLLQSKITERSKYRRSASSMPQDIREDVDEQVHCIQFTAVPMACRHIQELLTLRSEGFLVQDRAELSVVFI